MSKFRLYSIKPGKGYSNVNPLLRIIPHFKKKYEFVLRFDESIKYMAITGTEQQDWHKCFGLKESTRLDNSGRLGVRWYNEELQFAPYVHYRGENRGKMDPPLIYTTRNIREEIHGCIELGDGTRPWYMFTVNGYKQTAERGGEGLCRWLCWPYFEIKFKQGCEHAIKIKMKML